MTPLPRGLWLGIAALAVSAGLLLAPVATAPATRVLGNFQSEAATHVPVLAAALEGLTRHGPFVLADHPLHPQEVTGAMYEPITTLLMWPTYAAMGGGTRGFALAWNVWHLLVLVGTSVGAWIWARAWLGDEDADGWGAGTAMALASASLFVHLSPEVGRTEATNYPLYALHGGLLFRAAMGGGRGAWAWAAASVVPIVWSGGYGAVFFAVAETLVAAWALAVTPRRKETLGGLVAVAGAAIVAVLPLWWALKAHPYVGIAGRSDRETTPSVAYEVLFRGSESLLRELPGYEVAPFAGMVTLLVAVAAVVRWQSAVWPLAVGLLLYAIAAGPSPTLVGEPAWGPAALLRALPGPFALLSGWSRIFAFAVPIFAIGSAWLTRGRPAVALLIAGLALAETGSRRAQPASWWSFADPPQLTALREAGEAPIRLPLDGVERARRWLAGAEQPDLWTAMPEHLVFRYFQDALPNEPELFRSRFTAPEALYEPCELLADAAALRAKGFTSLYLREGFLPKDGRGTAVRALKAVFGVPREEGVWALPEAVPETCAVASAEQRPATIQLREGNAKNRPKTAEERAALRAARKAEREREREERRRERERKQRQRE